MESKMTEEEFRGYVSKFKLDYTKVSTLLFMTTGAVIRPQNIRTQIERQGAFSSPMTAALRLLFKVLEKNSVGI